jgi:hypothetical protein
LVPQEGRSGAREDNAQHTSPRSVAQETHAVSYQGALEQGLRDLSAWAERGVEPPPTTSYKVVNGQVRVPASAAKRNGIQPVVTVRANGVTKADVEVGARVELTARIEVPPDTGVVVAADWDFLGNGDYSAAGEIRPSRRSTTVTVTATYTFTAPGTFFPAIRVASQRDGDRDTPYARVQNLGRARVVVGSADDRRAVDTDATISGVDLAGDRSRGVTGRRLAGIVQTRLRSSKGTVTPRLTFVAVRAFEGSRPLGAVIGPGQEIAAAALATTQRPVAVNACTSSHRPVFGPARELGLATSPSENNRPTDLNLG